MNEPTIIKEPNAQLLKCTYLLGNHNKIKSSAVSFPWVIKPLNNETVAIDIQSLYEVYDAEHGLLAYLQMSSISYVSYLGNDTASRKIIEYLIYKSYDELLKAHAYQYKESILKDYEVRLPVSEEIAQDITDLLSTFPLSS